MAQEADRVSWKGAVYQGQFHGRNRGFSGRRQYAIASADATQRAQRRSAQAPPSLGSRSRCSDPDRLHRPLCECAVEHRPGSQASRVDQSPIHGAAGSEEGPLRANRRPARLPPRGSRRTRRDLLSRRPARRRPAASSLKAKAPDPSGAFQVYPGNDLLSHTVARAVPSALRGLTAVFGMGTGGSPSLQSPEIEDCLFARTPTAANLFSRHGNCRAPTRGAGRYPARPPQTAGPHLNQTLATDSSRHRLCTRIDWSSRTTD